MNHIDNIENNSNIDNIDNVNTSEQINSQDILNAIDLNKINDVEKRRRGRPRKKDYTPSISINNKQNDNNKIYNFENDEIILHLPLSKADLAKIDTDNIDVEHLMNKNSTSQISDETDIENSLVFNKDSSDTKSDYENNLLNMIDNDQQVKQLCLAIKKLKDENIELKKFITDITPMYFTEVKVYPSDLNLFDVDQNKFTPKKTDLCCWWCTCQFDTLPTYLPEKYSENNFYVSGCFCSFNCAGAYNMSLSDNKVWDRYSLLKLMYYMINKNKINSIVDIDINIAGPKELLNKYGGPMTIEEFRKNSKILGREYHKLIPPFIPVNSGFEEITNSKNNTTIPNLSSIMNSGKNHDNLIKRNKPLNNSASKQIDYFV